MFAIIKKSLIQIIVFSSFLFARTYTLEELIAEALRNSKQLRNMEKEMEKTNAGISQAWGKAMPHLRSSITMSHAFKQTSPLHPLQSLMESDGLEKIRSLYEDMEDHTGILRGTGSAITYASIDYLISEMQNAPGDSAIFSLTLNQPIFAQGKISKEIQSGKTAQRINICRYYDMKMKIKAEIVKIYFESLLAQKSVEIQKKAVELAKETHRLAVVRYVIGKASELDTLSSKLNLENAKIEVQKAQSNRYLTYETLITLTGIIEIPDSFSVSGEFPETVFELPLELVLGKVRESNYQISQLKGKEELKEIMVDMAKTEFYPYVFAGASLYKTGLFNGFSNFSKAIWGDNINVFVGLTWNLFTGLTRNQKLKKAFADKDQFRLIQQQKIEQIELLARRAYEKVVLNRDRMDAIVLVLDLSEKRYALAKKEYENGSKTLLDVQNAELELNRAKIKFNTAQYEFHTALVDLYLLMGDIEDY
ncbi:MAG TPA: TolC family protein [Chitinispirillaceae bacterium]|nr:TolC family protein [Chitinispirillaceae bacterium]